MTERKVEKVIETFEHSFEAVLDVPPGTTEIEKTRIVSVPVEHNDYDDKDVEIEEDFSKVHDKALELHDYLVDEMDDADQGKRARIAEVADQALNTALSALDKRRNMKQHIDILKQKDRAIDKKGGGKITNNNLFVGSQEEALEFVAKSLELADEKSKIIEHEANPSSEDT